MIAGLVTLLVGCVHPPVGQPDNAIRPPKEVERGTSISVAVNVAMGAWRTPVNLEYPARIAHLAEPNSAFSPASVVDLREVHDADTMLAGLRHAIEQYNLAQNEGDYRHIRFQVVEEAGRVNVRASEVWNGNEWSPASHVLDSLIAIEPTTARCGELIVHVARTALEATPDHKVSWSGSNPLSTAETSALMCAIEGTKTARAHIMDLLRQLERSTGEPWVITHVPVRAGADVARWGPTYSFLVRTLATHERFYDVVPFDKAYDDTAFGYRVHRDPDRPGPIRPPKRKLINPVN